MDSGTKFLTFTSVLILALILQGLLIIGETRETPEKAAIEFSRAYFWLDPSMAERLCSEFVRKSASDPIQAYLTHIGDTARSMGYGPDYMKQDLYQIEARTLRQGDMEAEVLLTATRKRAINPVFGAIGEAFGLTTPHRVEATLHLLLEEGRWKVCGRPFALTEG